MTSRRRVLAGLSAAGAALACRGASAIGDRGKIRVAQLRYTGNWDPHPAAALVWAQEIRFRTSIDVKLKRTVVAVEDDGLFELPFAVLLGDGRFRFTPRERARLQKWIGGGGLLFIDNTGRPEPSEPFDTAIRAELLAMFPGQALLKIPPQHVIYRAFYVLDFPAGRAIHRPYMEGLFLDGRLAVLYGQNDLTGALDRDPVGTWTLDMVPPGPSAEHQREKSKRMAINIVQYALCLDYKDDQVHLDYLLHNRRWRIRPPEIK